MVNPVPGAWLRLLLGGMALAACTAPAGHRAAGTEDLLAQLLGRCSARPLQARLSFDGEYRPYRDGACEPHDDAPTVPALRNLLRDQLRSSHSGEALWTRARFELAIGRASDGVEPLELARQLLPPDPELLVDLAAAYLARSRDEERALPGDRIAALAAAEAALAIDPLAPRALFNRALILASLHLDETARQAWHDYAELEPQTGWSSEAWRRGASPPEPDAREAWKAARSEISRATSLEPRAFTALVDRFPAATRAWAEDELLAEWATAWPRRTGAAARALALARGIATARRETFGDALLAEAVAQIEAALGAPRAGKLDRLLRGHRAYGRGLGFFETLSLDAARGEFEEARRLLAEAGSPFADWASVHLAICDYYERRYRASLAALTAIEARASRAGYRHLAARSQYLMGLNQNDLDLASASLRSYRMSLARFVALREEETVAHVEGLLAFHYNYIGDLGESWRHLSNALARLDKVTRPNRMYTLMYRCADTALRQGRPRVAVLFLDRVVEAAYRWGSVAVIAEGLWSRSRVLRGLGRVEEARADLEAAIRHTEKIASPSLQTRIRGDIAMTEGDARLATDPELAAAHFTRALDLYGGHDPDASAYPDHLIELYARRARAQLSLGESTWAERDLRRGIELYERRRRHVEDDASRIAYFGQADRLFDDMIRLQAVEQADPVSALHYVERSRARALLDRAASREGPLSASALRDRIPPGVTIVFYAALEERLLIWSVSATQTVMTERGLGAADLARLVGVMRHEIAIGEPEGASAAILYRHLVEPIRRYIGSAETLVVIPDKSLHRLPFAALRSAASGRYLLEDHIVTTAPSGSAWAVSAGRRSLSSRSSAVLVAGNPAFDRGRFPTLEPLPGAEAEALAVADLYPDSKVLVGAAATSSEFLRLLTAYDIVHYAGHAINSATSPERSRLLLAPDPERPDGVVQASEVGDLRFERTRLVVLSACSSAGGSLAANEGVVSLARPFLAAGVPAVIANLWDVEDRGARVLLTELHQQLRAGRKPAAALRGAQLALLRGPDDSLRRPSVWAGAQLSGAG